jgi:predicted amidohydrolase
LIDKAFHYGPRPDILFFHEFPITGWNTWTRKEILGFALELPGEETEQISKKAREYGCYVVFGTYAKDPDWPGHVLSITTIIDPKGEIVGKHWKARNIKGVFHGFELFTTTIYDVYDRYVEMYGLDEVIPVTRTPIGNIATTSTQLEPELIRAMAMKGAEIVLRTATGGFSPLDIQASALYNSIYVALANNAYSPDNPGFFDDPGSGAGSVIYGRTARPLPPIPNSNDDHGTNPVEAFRIGTVSRWSPELYLPFFERYRSNYPPNLFTPYQPEDLRDARSITGKSAADRLNPRAFFSIASFGCCQAFQPPCAGSPSSATRLEPRTSCPPPGVCPSSATREHDRLRRTACRRAPSATPGPPG